MDHRCINKSLTLQYNKIILGCTDHCSLLANTIGGGITGLVRELYKTRLYVHLTTFNFKRFGGGVGGSFIKQQCGCTAATTQMSESHGQCVRVSSSLFSVLSR